MRADVKRVSRLVKMARGQTDAALDMIDSDRYCMDISNQIMATGSVLARANKEVLRGHMESCVRQAFETGSADEKIEELLVLLDKLMK